MTNNARNAAVLTVPKFNTRRDSKDHLVFEMVLELQTTLILEELLDLFTRHLGTMIPNDGFEYRNDRLGICLKSGEKRRHSCTYTLKLEEEVLGEWRMSRDRRFTEADLEQTEAFLCRLVYPLRNALRYREAMSFANTDLLTQTGNRVCLLSNLQRELEVARRYGAPLSVIFLDVDHFKLINDTYGHDVGDMVLRKLAGCLKENVRASDAVFRYGGEEFVIVMSNTHKSGARNLAERIRAALESLVCDTGSQILRITASLGVATLRTAESHMKLLKRADEAMYLAKRGGRNRIVVAEG